MGLKMWPNTTTNGIYAGDTDYLNISPYNEVDHLLFSNIDHMGPILWVMSLHFSFEIECTFCSLKASTKMYLFCIGTNTASFRTFRLSSQVLDKARVYRHPGLDSRLTWPKWSEPNMRSPPPSVSPGINLSAGQGLNIQITASPTSLICVTDQNTIFRPTSPSSTLFVEFILNSFSIYGHK